MHPNVFKKHHKPQRLILVFFYIMILCHSAICNSSCNSVVKRTKIYSEFTKGYLRIVRNKVMAAKSDSSYYLYKVTIDRHKLLLYDMNNAKFICWNKDFTRIVAKRNPANLTYCKFEEKVSELELRKNYSVRFTIIDNLKREREIRVTKQGAFIDSFRLLENKKPKKLYEKLKEYKCIFQKEILKNSNCSSILNHRSSADFLPSDDACFSNVYLIEFCTKMKLLRNRGHTITFEIVNLCKNEWNRKSQ